MATPRLAIEEIDSQQYQKEVTANNAFRRLEQVSARGVAKDKDLATPPGSPADGDSYIVASSPTGAWVGHTGDVAYYAGGTWYFIDPFEGLEIYLQDENAVYRYDGSWTILTAGESNTASNVNVGGVGVFKQKTGVNLEFRGINAGSSKLTVTLDAGNNEIDLDVAQANIDHDALTNFVADEHIAHSSVTFSAGTGLTGGGTIAANRSYALSHLGLETLTDPNFDRIAFWDDSAGAFAWLAPSTGLAISGTNLALSFLGFEALTDPNADRISFWDDSAGAFAWLAPGTGLSISGTMLSQSAEFLETTLQFMIDGGGSAITTGLKGFMRVPFNCTVTGWEITEGSGNAGNIVVDVWKDTYANYPPTVADTITGSEKPTLSAAAKNTDTALSTWTTTLTRGEYLGFNVDSAATVQRVNVALMVQRTG